MARVKFEIEKNGRKFLVFPSKEEAISFAGQRTVELLLTARREGSSRLSLALSGGSAAESYFASIRQQNRFPWSQTEIFQVDERLVPRDSPDSNGRLIDQYLGETEARLHLVRTELGALQAAEIFRHELIEIFQKSKKNGFSLVVLGLGIDGHTASLFPGQERELTSQEAVLITESPEKPSARISLGIEPINNSDNIIAIVVGDKKSNIIKRLFNNNQRDPALPFSYLQKKNIEIILDQDAGQEITP